MAKAADYDVAWSKVEKRLPKVNALITELEKLNDELDTLLSTKMYPNFQSTKALKVYNSYAGNMCNTNKWCKAMKKWNSEIITAAKYQ